MQAKITTSLVRQLSPRKKPYEVFDTALLGFILRVQPSGSMSYYLAYRTRDGKPKRFRLGRADALTVRQARDVAEKQAALVTTGVDIQEVHQHARAEAQQVRLRTLGGFIEQSYASWVRAERKTGEATLARLQHNFAHWYDRPLDGLTPWLLEQWRAEQLKHGKKRGTINRDMTALKAVLSKAVAWGQLETHPLAKLKPLKMDTAGKIRYLTPKETARLRQALSQRDERLKTARERGNAWRHARGYAEFPSLMACAYADHLTPMVLLTLNTGLRRGELFNLAWQDIDFSTDNLTVQGAGAKSGQTRHIPINQEARAILTAWRAQSHGNMLVFPGKDGHRLDNVRKAWGRVLTEAKIEDFRWHDLRHDFASKLVMRGVPLNTVRELLGHADLSTTLRYAHLAPDHKAEAVGRLVSRG